MINARGKLITLEGVEGSGKSTLSTYLQHYLLQKNKDVVLTREPGGTEIAEEIRGLLLRHHAETLLPKTEALLMFASRVQHWENKILPALDKGQWLISDRFFDASYAYQGAGRLLGFEAIHALKTWCMGDIAPDLTILLDVPHALSVSRLQRRLHLDRIEQEKADFFERVTHMYLELASRYPARFCVIDASQSLDQVQSLAAARLDVLLKE